MAHVDVDETFANEEVTSDYASELESHTTSLASQVTNYKFINGRRFHAYEDGRYVFPNDAQESDRLDMMHQMVQRALGGIYTAPVTDPKRIIDLGTGTGIWAMEVADKFPQADVIGNDISPIQPRWVPPNIQFEVDDVEKPWTFSKPFDFIHCRGMYGAIKDWPGLLEKCFDMTEEGGYCEFTDWDSNLVSPDNSLPADCSLKWLNNVLSDHLAEAGTTVSPGPHLEKWVRDAGYEIVKVRVNALPLGMWAADPVLKEIGAWNYLQIVENVDAFATYILHQVKGWAIDDVNVLCAKVRNDMKNKKYHAMTTLYNVVGKRPQKKSKPEELSPKSE